MTDMDVRAKLLPRKEEETKFAFPEDGW